MKITVENILAKLQQEVVGSSVADRAAMLKEAEISDSKVWWSHGRAAHYLTIEEKLKKIGEGLPIYVALYAEKDEVFRFLLEMEVVTENQWR